MNYYLDTDTCIFALRGDFLSIKKQLQNTTPQHIKIPSIVQAELFLGALKSKNPKDSIHKVGSFLEPFEYISFESQAAIAYARIRYDLEKEGKSIGPNDLIIAAVVLANQGTLVTHNVNEFSRVPGLLIEDWTV